MLEKLQSISERYDYLNEVLGTEDIFSDQNRYREVSKEHSDIAPIVQTYQKYLKVINELAETEKLSKESEDRELREIAAEEAGELQAQKEKLEKELRVLLSPKDPADDKNAIMEIRAGTGGMEAALFAADLYKMYSRFIERMGWKLEDLSVSGSDVGGFKEIIFLVKGKNAYGRLKFEGGVHRVQRVPATEASGRIHTSAASVVVLPEAEEVEIKRRALLTDEERADEDKKKESEPSEQGPPKENETTGNEDMI
ncbi:PCRF domain-containing protein [candidate division KSB1 bacterium]|nr:PCRF domain-containing protein [candidate division KSB1 bacterium]